MLKRIFLFAVVLLVVTGAHAQWSTGGPSVTGTSYDNCLAVKGSKIFAGTSSGLYVSADSGASWSALTSAVPGPGTKAIMAVYATGSYLYASVNNNIYVSTTDGASWTDVSSGKPGGVLFLEFTSIGSTVFAVGQGSGIYKSVNNGTTWTLSNTGNMTLPYHICTDGTNLYCGSENANIGVYMSTNQGTSWASIGGPRGTNFYGVTALAAKGSNLYVGTSGHSVYITTNAGTTWTSITNGITSTYNIFSLAVTDTAQAACTGSVFAGTQTAGLYMAPADGSQWTSITAGGLSSSGYIRAIAIMGTKLLVQTSGSGVYQRTLPTAGTLTPPVITATKNSICSSNDSSQLCAPGTFSSYKWNTGPTANCLNVKQTGTYYVTVTDANGCTAESNRLTIGSATATTPVITATKNTICGSNDSANLCVTQNYTAYKWNTGPTAKCLAAKQTGSYYVTITDNNGCTAESNRITIAAGTAVVPSVNTPPNSFCPGDSTQLCTTTAYSAYLWSTGSTAGCIQAKQSGSYYVTVTDANGCTAQSNQVTVSTYTAPAVTISGAGGATGFCGGDSLLVCTNNTFASYQWNVTGAGQCIQAKTSGEYYVRVTDNNGCKAESNRLMLLNSTAQPATISAATGIFCASDSVQVCVGNSFTTYKWNVGGNGQCVQAKQAGNYYVTVTDANGCTAESNRVSLSVYTVQQVAITIKGDTLSSFGAVSYRWYLNGTLVQSGPDSIYIARAGGTYTLGVTDANGCTTVSNPVLLTGIDAITTHDTYFEVYPNPAAGGTVQLLTAHALAGSKLLVYDMAGRVVKTYLPDGTRTTLDISTLQAGVYTLSLQGMGSHTTRKLVVTW